MFVFGSSRPWTLQEKRENGCKAQPVQSAAVSMAFVFAHASGCARLYLLSDGRRPHHPGAMGANFLI
jgi:hypothetical protein